MAYTRTITQLISDVRIRADVVSALARHPDAEIQRFIVESIQTLRALLTDAGSHRFLAPLKIDTLDYVSDIPGAIGLQMVDSAETPVVLPESIQTVRVKWSGEWREIRRVSVHELIDAATSEDTCGPLVWCDMSAGTGSLSQPNPVTNSPAVRLLYLAPWSGSASSLTGNMIVVGIPGIPAVTADTDVCLEQYGYEWVVADVALKIATRDNDAQERAQLLMAARADAEKRMLATISRERAPSVQRRQAPAARVGSYRRRWD